MGQQYAPNFLCRRCAFQGVRHRGSIATTSCSMSRALACATTEKLLLVTHNVKLSDFWTSPTQLGKPDDIAVKVLSMLSPSMLNEHIPLSVLADGNCMYRALSRGLFGTENHHLHVRLLTALEIRQNRKLYISGKEFVDLVCDSRVFHDCNDSIVKSTTEPCRYSEMLHNYAASVTLSVRVNSYFPPQPRGANFEADTLSRIVNGCINVLGTHMSPQRRIQLFLCEFQYANPRSFVPHNPGDRSSGTTADRTPATASSCSRRMRVCECCVGRTRGSWTVTFNWRRWRRGRAWETSSQAADRRGVIERVRHSKGPREDADGEVRHPTL